MLTNNNMGFGGHHIIFPLLDYLLCFGSYNRMFHNSKIVLRKRHIESRAFNPLLSMLFVPLTLKSKERCGYRTISFGGVHFHSASAGSHSESCSFFCNCESTRWLCSKHLSCSSYGYGGNWKLEI